MIVDEKPGVYISLTDNFPLETRFLHIFQHVIVGTLKQADQVRRKVFVQFSGKVRGVLEILIFIGSHQDTVADLGLIAAGTGE